MEEPARQANLANTFALLIILQKEADRLGAGLAQTDGKVAPQVIAEVGARFGKPKLTIKPCRKLQPSGDADICAGPAWASEYGRPRTS